jgi:hypothetical protein
MSINALEQTVGATRTLEAPPAAQRECYADTTGAKRKARQCEVGPSMLAWR